jgi:hypothetical protein
MLAGSIGRGLFRALPILRHCAILFRTGCVGGGQCVLNFSC